MINSILRTGVYGSLLVDFSLLLQIVAYHCRPQLTITVVSLTLVDISLTPVGFCLAIVECTDGTSRVSQTLTYHIVANYLYS